MPAARRSFSCMHVRPVLYCFGVEYYSLCHSVHCSSLLANKIFSSDAVPFSI